MLVELLGNIILCSLLNKRKKNKISPLLFDDDEGRTEQGKNRIQQPRALSVSQLPAHTEAIHLVVSFQEQGDS